MKGEAALIGMERRKAQAVLEVCPVCQRTGPKARLAEHLREDHVEAFLAREPA